MARILMIGGGCRGMALAGELSSRGHAVRIVTRHPTRRPAIEAAGAECLVGDPNRLATMRGALEHVTIACWLLATASGDPEELAALHTSRLEQFLASAVDTTMRGFVYEAPSLGPASGSPDLAAGEAVPGGGEAGVALGGEEAGVAPGEQIVAERTARNAIPVAVLRADPGDVGAWTAAAMEAIDDLLAGRGLAPGGALS